MSVTLRRMRWWDIAFVMELERALFPEDAWSPELFWSELADPDNHWYVVAEEAGELVGYAGLAVIGDEGHVQTIAVRRDRQGRGVGRTLLSALLDEAARRGCREVLLEVRADNPRAQELYRRFGFTVLGVRPRYYQPAGVDGIVMRLKDVQRRLAAYG
ncbi:ribosomal-protein-alanine N-acetyltransferase [Carbonactinospora thermoautotrophica]|uniref:ribosomal protein S18-alanine N-acetyltransferase n=1 Tax=Carbonactinospora thermoautotrophica TaxID=1469144 RepID=UPI00226D9223|nr:ribosomal protein S18-alanine N-acetyltransferase [Carbonactinospora thermoautotrophica]MCX9190482.1 ribosomal-protein-alanine N-acetyltransferase [Carbonactinospora thermoautotrophica]